jgi:hypothetical protein
MPIGKFFGSAYRLDARAQGVVRVHVWGHTVTSVDPTEARNAPATSVEPCRASSLGMSRSSGRPALVPRHARPPRRWIAAILPRRQSSRCRCDRTWPRPALWASSAARITWPQSAASSRSMYASCGPRSRSRVRTLCTVPCCRRGPMGVARFARRHAVPGSAISPSRGREDRTPSFPFSPVGPGSRRQSVDRRREMRSRLRPATFLRPWARVP